MPPLGVVDLELGRLVRVRGLMMTLCERSGDKDIMTLHLWLRERLQEKPGDLE